MPVETFTKPREFMENLRYSQDRQDTLALLDPGSIDEPIRDIIAGFSALQHCFTLRSCYGHFLCTTGQEPRNLDPIPQGYTGPVTYRIAYIAFRLEDSHRGRTLRQSLSRISAIDPGYIQFGSADWFWERCVNSYALQARPATHMLEDQFVLDCMEALNTQRAGNRLFHELRLLLAVETGELLTR